MEWLNSIKNKILSTNVYGFGAEMPADEPRMPVYPGWFYTAPFGQPRSINISDIRDFSKSPWVQMVKNTVKKEVSTIDWEIVNVDPDDDTDYKEDIKKVEDFLNNINSDHDDFKDILIPIMNDIMDIDAGAWIKVYSLDSYEKGMVPLYSPMGDVAEEVEGLVLKPLGQRTLNEVRFADGSTMLRQVDIYRRTLNWFQYSFKNPRTNPKKFYPEEVIYFMMNIKSDSVYGFSPVQAIESVLELLMNSTRWNKDFFKKNQIPDGIIGLPGANAESMKKFKQMWKKLVQGKSNKLIFNNTAATFEQFNKSPRDMEWLEGQKWYFHLVFAVFGLSPAEAGFHEDVNRSTQEGQERVTVKNAIKPYLTLIEKKINRCIITEILQDENPKIMFKYKPMDHSEEQIQFKQNMEELTQGALTINEYRKSKGRDPVEWGDVPMSITNTPDMEEDPNEEEDKKDNNKPPTDPNKPKEKMIPFSKAFESYMSR